MTYRQLKDKLNDALKSELDQDVSVYVSDMDEVWPVYSIGMTTSECEKTDGILDEGHLFLDTNIEE